LSLINEGYIFTRGSTWIRWDKVSVQTGGMGGFPKKNLKKFIKFWADGWTSGMGGLEEWVDGWVGKS